MTCPIRTSIAGAMIAVLALASPQVEAAGGVSGNEAASVAPFVSVAPIVVPIIHNDHPMGFLIIEFILDAADSAAATQIKRHMPRLRDGFIQTLHEYTWFEYKVGHIVRPARIERRLNDVADWVLRDIETRILFKQIMIQKSSP